MEMSKLTRHETAEPVSFFFFFFFFHLTYSRWTSSLPSCLWSQRIFPSLPGSRLTFFLSRCKFSTLTTRQLMVEFYLLTFPRFPSRKKEHKSYFGKNRTHDFRTSRCAAYLLHHSGDRETKFYGRERNQGNIHFPRSADHVQDWQPYPVHPYSCYMCDHTLLYRYTSIHVTGMPFLRRKHTIDFGKGFVGVVPHYLPITRSRQKPQPATTINHRL